MALRYSLLPSGTVLQRKWHRSRRRPSSFPCRRQCPKPITLSAATLRPPGGPPGLKTFPVPTPAVVSRTAVEVVCSRHKNSMHHQGLCQRTPHTRPLRKPSNALNGEYSKRKSLMIGLKKHLTVSGPQPVCKSLAKSQVSQAKPSPQMVPSGHQHRPNPLGQADRKSLQCPTRTAITCIPTSHSLASP